MPDQDHLHHADVTIDPTEADQQAIGKYPVVTPANEAKGMLPGIAGISLFMLLISMIGAFGAVRGVYAGASRYMVLTLATLIMIGVFGLLRLTRWGWALVTGGCLMMSVGYMWLSHAIHQPALLVMGLFTLCFFLYLSRTEVRDRLH